MKLMKTFQNLDDKSDLSDNLIKVDGIVVHSFEALDYYKHEVLQEFVNEAKKFPGADMILVGYSDYRIQKLMGGHHVFANRQTGNQNHLSEKGLRDCRRLYGALGKEMVTS